ncbi:MAG: PAS domain S-box protein [Deltaproteobacteria bacterium]|nr:PAS domain S-box protein [Deltaproteobacteria bacterium]
MNLRHAPDTALSPDPPKDYDALGRALAEAQDVRRLWGLTLGYLRARRGIVGGVYMLNRREDELQRLTTSDEREELRLLSNSFGLQTDVVWEVLSSGAPFQYNLPEPEPDDDLNVAAWSHGIRHCAIFPLRRGAVAWGLALFPQSRPFTEDQMAELDLVIRLTCAHDLAIQASARHTLADGMLNALMSASDQGVIVASESGEILYYNDRLAALSGWSRADVDRVGWLNLAYPDPTYRAQVTATLRELLRSDGYRARWLITCRGGDERPVEVSTRAVSDPLTGKRVLMGTFRDLSEPRPVGIEPPPAAAPSRLVETSGCGWPMSWVSSWTSRASACGASGTRCAPSSAPMSCSAPLKTPRPPSRTCSSSTWACPTAPRRASPTSSACGG